MANSLRSQIPLFLIAAVLTLFAAEGCSREESEPASTQAESRPGQNAQEKPRPVNPLSAPAEYLHTVTVRAPKHARKTVELAQLKNELGQFRAIHNRLPRSLEEFEKWRGARLPEAPKGYQYHYDPQKGEMSVAPRR